MSEQTMNPDAEDVARAIAGVVARKAVGQDGGFKTFDREALIQDTVETMWPSLIDEARAAMEACGVT